MNISKRLKQLEKMVQNISNMVVVIAEQITGGYVIANANTDEIFTLSELEQFASDHGVEAVIIDDL